MVKAGIALFKHLKCEDDSMVDVLLVTQDFGISSGWSGLELFCAAQHK